MKFERAYCIELKRIITPYTARELYFDEDGEFFGTKLNFQCEDKECRKELISVGTYREKKTKRALHFRSKDAKEHICNCNDESKDKSGKKLGKDDSFKVTKFPEEFILNPPKTKNMGGSINEIDEEEGNKSNKATNSAGLGISTKYNKYRISSFEHLVDCFTSGDEKILKNQNLTINGKTKNFVKFFKPVKYYKDEEGLIYYGKVGSIKKYGKNYSIYFEDRVHIDGEYKHISIYITEELIDKFSRRKLFRQQLDDLIENINDVNINCYFVGVYPEVKTYKVNDIEKTSISVDLEDLRHFVLNYI